MKRLLYLTCACVVLVVAAAITDSLIARRQSHTLRARLGSEDYLAGAEARIQPGMTRAEVEETISGFRRAENQRHDKGHLVRYGYWFGFIPPIPGYGFKYAGEVEVLYSEEWTVIESSHWVN